MTRPQTSWTIGQGINAITELFEDWDLAEKNVDAPSPYCGRSYTVAVLEAYHDNDNPILVCAYVEGKIAGVLALVERPLVRMGLTVREIGFPFNPNTIINHPLIDVADFEDAVAVATALIEGAFEAGADNLLSDHMPTDSGLAEIFHAAARALEMKSDAPTPARALYFGTMGGDWPTYLASRSRNHRWQIKKAMRKASEEDTIKVLRWKDREDLRTHLEDWFLVEKRSWQGAGADTAMSDADRRFHRQLVEDLPEQMLGDLWVVHVEGQPVAALRMLATQGQVSVHTMHFDADFKAQAPGAIAFHAMMQAACDEGLDEVDMHGTTSFFSRYASGQRDHQSLRVYRKGLRGAILQKMRSALQIKQKLKAVPPPNRTS